MSHRSVSTFFLLVVLLAGCTAPRTAPDATLDETIFRTWMESHEERSDEVEVYRDSAFRFPPARGREGFTIERSGEFIWHRIAPADGNMDIPARWRLDDGSNTILIISDPATGKDTDRITIVSLEPAVLKVTRRGI